LTVLRVGWLAYGVDRPLSGVTRYALELGRALRERSECEIVYLTPYHRGPFRGERAESTAYLAGCRRLPALMTLGGLAIVLAARRHRLDIVHDPAGIAPFPFNRRLAPFRRVVTIHDAIAHQYPEGYPWLNNVLQRRYLPAMLRNVDAVISVSRHARRDLTHFLPHLPPGEFVVPPALSTQFRRVVAGERRPVLERLGLRRPYILSVGAQQERKNLRGLIRAFAAFHARLPAYQLVLAGPTLWRFRSLQEEIGSLSLGGSVLMLGYVSEVDLAAVYSGASLFAFPSLYEGFGMPVLEAMACGTPVICSDTTALPETAAGAALLVDPTDPAAIAAAMERVLTNPRLADALRERGRMRAGECTWEATATQTMAVYRQIFD
jgi:glycosyltransferase involved in cell wall biosynthesis